LFYFDCSSFGAHLLVAVTCKHSVMFVLDLAVNSTSLYNKRYCAWNSKKLSLHNTINKNFLTVPERGLTCWAAWMSLVTITTCSTVLDCTIRETFWLCLNWWWPWLDVLSCLMSPINITSCWRREMEKERDRHSAPQVKKQLECKTRIYLLSDRWLATCSTKLNCTIREMMTMTWHATKELLDEPCHCPPWCTSRYAWWAIGLITLLVINAVGNLRCW